MNHEQLYQQAEKILPAGVNSPVRAFRAVGGSPVFAKKGKGAEIWDEENKRYIDFCGSWGALLFGHAPASLISSLAKEIKNGTSFGIATRKEVELAEQIRAYVPSMEMLRLVSSGTEAVMSAVRLARGFTGRNKIVKIEGGYHGHVDSLLVKAGSGGATFGIPDSAGVPEELARHTINVPFNDPQALEEIFRRQGDQIAALILEPVPANMGVVLPKPGYLEHCRRVTLRHGALLIFDEVITGFRVHPGGAQALYNIHPDLSCFGKILGGGLPLAAFGGRKDVMQKLAPLGPVYQAGTLSGNPVAVSAALWVMKQLKTQTSGRKLKMKNVIQENNNKAEDFFAAIRNEIKRRGLPLQLNTCASMFTIFFTKDPVTDYASAKKSDTKQFAIFFRSCLNRGLYLAPAQFEANFVSTAHTPEHLQRALKVFSSAF